MADAVGVAVRESEQQLPEVVLGGLGVGASVDLNAVEQLAAHGQLQHQENGGLGIVHHFQHFLQLEAILVSVDLGHAGDFAENRAPCAHKFKEFSRDGRDLDFKVAHSHCVARTRACGR